MRPRLTVVLPTRDRRPALARALASCDAQRFRDFEIVVVDDGSADDTAAWLRAERPAVQRLELATPVGAGAARNRGVAAARGELVAFLDDDDRWRPDYLAEQVARFDAEPALDLVHADQVEVDAGGRRSPPDLRPLRGDDGRTPLVRLLAGCFIHTLSAVVCRRDLFDRFGGFDERLRVVHDFDWFARLLAGGARFARTPRVLVERAVPGGLVRRHRDWHAEERRVILEQLAATPVSPRDARFVRVSRALLFARIAFAKGDFGFGAARLGEALRTSPALAASLAAQRLLRLRTAAPRAAAAAWSDAPRDSR